MAFSFGAAAQQPATSTGFGGFGQTATSTAPTTTFGGFGSNTATSGAPSTTFGGFGQNATSAAPATGFGGFGQTNTATSVAPTTGFGGFGQTSTAPSTGFGGFGQTATSTAPSTGFGGFGQTATSTAPSTGFGGFGQTATSTAPTSGFGGFGSNTGSTGFSFGSGGAANKPVFGSSTTADQQRTQQIYTLLCQADEEARKKQAPSITSEGYKPDNVWQALSLLKAYWDPKSSHCKFKHYFYNIVTPQELARYQKPANADAKAWAEAVKNNPDPSLLVPALAVGFDDVTKRMDLQHKLSEAHQHQLDNISSILQRIEKEILHTHNKMNEYKRKHMETTQRVIQLLKYAQVLRNKGLSITSLEDDMRVRLETIQETLNQSEQFHGKLSQLWAQLQLIKESGRKYTKTSHSFWQNMSSQDTEQVSKLLEQHEGGLGYMITTLEKDANTMELVRRGYE